MAKSTAGRFLESTLDSIEELEKDLRKAQARVDLQTRTRRKPSDDAVEDRDAIAKQLRLLMERADRNADKLSSSNEDQKVADKLLSRLGSTSTRLTKNPAVAAEIERAKPKAAAQPKPGAVDVFGSPVVAPKPGPMPPSFGTDTPALQKMADQISSGATEAADEPIYEAPVEEADPDPIIPGEKPPSTPEEVNAYIRKHYPTMAHFLDIPEIADIIDQAARQQLDKTEVDNMVRGTGYWKTTGPAARNWKILQAEDPAAARAKFYDTVTAIKNAGLLAGANFSDADLFSITGDFITGGWSQGDLNRFMAKRLREQNTGGLPEGESRGLTNSKTAADADALGKVAKQYGVPLSRAALEEWAVKMLEGTATKEGFTSYVTGMAKSRWLHDKDVLAALDAGVAPETYFDSYREIIARTLELNPSSVDILGDRKFAAVTQMYDDKIGGKRSMTLGEAEDWARQQPEFEKTKTYRQTEASFALKLGQMFGAA